MMDYNAGVTVAGTFPMLLRLNANEHGHEVALREKDLGLWRVLTWHDYQSRVCDFALGLLEIGLQRGDVAALVGANRSDWVSAEIVIHAIGGISLGVYTDALSDEVAHLLNCGQAKLVFAEDEEQVDKLLGLGERIPDVRRIVYCDPLGMRKHYDRRLIHAGKLAALGRKRAKREPTLYDQLVDATESEDVAILCTTSGTTARPKLAMHTAGRLLCHCAVYLGCETQRAGR